MKSEHPLAAFRKAQALSLDALAKRLGVNKSTVLRWEMGAVPLPLARLGEISEMTGIPREQLRPDVFAPSMQAAS